MLFLNIGKNIQKLQGENKMDIAKQIKSLRKTKVYLKKAGYLPQGFQKKMMYAHLAKELEGSCYVLIPYAKTDTGRKRLEDLGLEFQKLKIGFKLRAEK